MSRVAVRSLITLFFAAALACAHAASRFPSEDQQCVVLQISDLRSAYLQRAGVVRYDESNRSPAGLRQQLQRHFDVVLTLLDVQAPDSIETAVGRLEAADDHSWTAGERTDWRQELLAARRVQVQRLAAYRDRGIFPLNESQSAFAAPIFVDRHGTDCAVGHLMRCSGRAEDVAAIAKANNLVYVPDAAQGDIAAWVLTSGLTLEEAALIQPGYPWTGAQFDASDYEPGELSIERDGLRFSNFRLQAQNYVLPYSPTASGTKPTLSGLGLLTGMGSYTQPLGGGFSLTHVPIGTHWLAIAPSNTPKGLHNLGASADVGRGQLVAINFDVTAIDPRQRINGITESSREYWGGFQSWDGGPLSNAAFYLTTKVFDGPTSLTTLTINQTTPGSGFTPKRDTRSFDAKQQISVEANVWLQNGVAMQTYVLDFNVVPEPTSGLLCAALIGTCVVTRKSLISGDRAKMRFIFAAALQRTAMPPRPRRGSSARE